VEPAPVTGPGRELKPGGLAAGAVVARLGGVLRAEGTRDGQVAFQEGKEEE
jgi:hypothetical protein